MISPENHDGLHEGFIFRARDGSRSHGSCGCEYERILPPPAVIDISEPVVPSNLAERNAVQQQVLGHLAGRLSKAAKVGATNIEVSSLAGFRIGIKTVLGKRCHGRIRDH